MTKKEIARLEAIIARIELLQHCLRIGDSANDSLGRAKSELLYALRKAQ